MVPESVRGSEKSEDSEGSEGWEDSEDLEGLDGSVVGSVEALGVVFWGDLDPGSVEGLALGCWEDLDPGSLVGEDSLPDNDDASLLQAWELAWVVWHLAVYLVGLAVTAVSEAFSGTALVAGAMVAMEVGTADTEEATEDTAGTVGMADMADTEDVRDAADIGLAQRAAVADTSHKPRKKKINRFL